jgi:transcriptional regulator with PAS, ATPase and Fis domain
MGDIQQHTRDGYRTRGAIVAKSKSMLDILHLVQKIGPLRSTVLVQGESGTGKELVARAIHDSGSRAQRRFVALNCAVIPAPLLESELFGYEKGAFTGADSRRIGYFEAADGGTIFLDEVSEMPLELQVKLLRVLQERCFQRLGGNEEIPTDVRIIASTNRDLAEEVRRGTFRKDLFYRLNVITLSVPPLRERPEDISTLAATFLRRYEREFEKDIRGIAPDVMQLLLEYRWDGNVRELENVMECAVAVAENDEITLADLPLPLRGLSAAAQKKTAFDVKPFTVAKEEFEREYFTVLLRKTNGNVSRAARVASLPRTYLYEKMRKAGIRRNDVVCAEPVHAFPDTV